MLALAADGTAMAAARTATARTVRATVPDRVAAGKRTDAGEITEPISARTGRRLKLNRDARQHRRQGLERARDDEPIALNEL